MRDVGLVRWQGYAEMTDDLLDRLMREAIDETRNAAAAEGFFSPTIDVDDRSQIGPGRRQRSRSTPGEPTRITSVQIAVTGPAATDAPLGTDAIAQAHPRLGTARRARSSGNRRGPRPRQRPSPRSRPVPMRRRKLDAERSGDRSRAPQRGPRGRDRQRAAVSLRRLRDHGTREVRRRRWCATSAPSRPASRTATPSSTATCGASMRRAISRACRRRSIRTRRTRTTRPVNIAVIEAPTEAVRRRRRVLDRRAVPRQRELSRRQHRRQRDCSSSPRRGSKRRSSRDRCASRGRRTTPAGSARSARGAERTDIESLVTRTAFAGTRWHTIEERNEHAVSATFYLDEQEPVRRADANRARALSGIRALLAARRRPHRADDGLDGERVQAGGGIPGVSTRGFGRVRGRFAAWLPLDK